MERAWNFFFWQNKKVDGKLNPRWKLAIFDEHKQSEKRDNKIWRKNRYRDFEVSKSYEYRAIGAVSELVSEPESIGTSKWLVSGILFVYFAKVFRHSNAQNDKIDIGNSSDYQYSIT